MVSNVFLKNGLYYVLFGTAVIIIGQAVLLVVAGAADHPIFELKSSSHWLMLVEESDTERLKMVFLYQPLLVTGLSAVYLLLRCCRIFGYNQLFFAFCGGTLNALLVLFLLLWTSAKVHADLSSLALIVSVLLGFFSGFFSAPYFLRSGLRPEKEKETEMAAI